MRHTPFAVFLALLVILAGAVLSACQAAQRTQPAGADTPTAAPTAAPEVEGPRLRIANNGPQALEDLVVLFPDARIEFGDIPAGETSEYQVVTGGVYNYAAYEYTQDGQQMVQPVIDWVGETGRMQGDFTYVLSYDPTRTDMLAIELVQTIVE
jgi:hypothetical protein